MQRLIDANEIEKVLEEKHFNRVLDSDRWIIADIKKSIMDLPTIETVPQWIPCSERLPEENGTYLVYAPDYRGGSSGGKEWHDGIMFAKFKAGKWSIEHGYYSRPNCVMAWMPLPKPYEVEHD